MSILGTIEAVLDRVVPRVESSSVSTREISQEEFLSLPDRLAEIDTLKITAIEPKSVQLRCAGSSRSALASASVLVGAAPDPRWYSEVKSRLQIDHLADGRVKVTAYEHMLGFPSERRVFAQLLLAQSSDMAAAISTPAAQQSVEPDVE